MKRSPLKSDPAKTAAWQQRGRANSLKRGNGLKRTASRSATLPAALRAPVPASDESCWLAAHGVSANDRALPPCDGRLVRAHLIPQSWMRREFAALGLDVQALVGDPRGWVWACGGIAGNSGCHGRLDCSRTLRVPRWALPRELEEFALELGVRAVAFLDREYGPVDYR